MRMTLLAKHIRHDVLGSTLLEVLVLPKLLASLVLTASRRHRPRRHDQFYLSAGCKKVAPDRQSWGQGNDH